MQTALTLLKSRRFSVNSFNESCFIHHAAESYSVYFLAMEWESYLSKEKWPYSVSLS